MRQLRTTKTGAREGGSVAGRDAARDDAARRDDTFQRAVMGVLGRWTVPRTRAASAAVPGLSTQASGRIQARKTRLPGFLRVDAQTPQIGVSAAVGDAGQAPRRPSLLGTTSPSMGKDSLPRARTPAHDPGPLKRLDPPEALRVLDKLARLEDATFLEDEGGEVARRVLDWRAQVRRGVIACADVPAMAAEFERWGITDIA